QVKQIMEESVTRKFVHEESSSIISLCAAVECCLQHGLKKRALGLFKNSTTMALLQKVAKSFEPAARLVKILNELEKMHDRLFTTTASSSSSASSLSSNHLSHLSRKTNSKYLWLRVALYEKQLAKIVDYLVRNSSKYYEKEALISDPVCGAILASLLVGPCALEFSHMKTVDHLWTDPPAKELMQRHRIHSSTNHHLAHADSPKRLALQVLRRNVIVSSRTTPMIAKEYVESLHQNNKSTLLYGKNNVIIQPVCADVREDIQPMAGYLSLHQNNSLSLVVKWTPNQLMNIGNNDNNNVDGNNNAPSLDRSQYWNYALAINLDDIVYLHCHQQADSGGIVVMVGHDGVQRPPIRLPRGGHLHAFLSCIEAGLSPRGHLEPPLNDSVSEGVCHFALEDIVTDLSYYFVMGVLIVFFAVTQPDDALPMLIKKKIGGASHMLSSLIGSMTDEITSAFNQSLTAVRQLCDTMTSQILSRAFYGWLSHCRQLKTVRTHLSGLVNATIHQSEQPANQKQAGLTKECWKELTQSGKVSDELMLYKLVYYGGCDGDIRKEVWPFLLEHYRMDSTVEDRQMVDERTKDEYYRLMDEWKEVEAYLKTQVSSDEDDDDDLYLMMMTISKLSTAPGQGEANRRRYSDVDDSQLLQQQQQRQQQQQQQQRHQVTDDVVVDDGDGYVEDDDDVDDDVEDVVYSDKSQNDALLATTTPTTTSSAAPTTTTSSSSITTTATVAVAATTTAAANGVDDIAAKYTADLLESFALNLHRIDKDVHRCDRNHAYFAQLTNLSKLRNVMGTYVWQNMEMGYVQGMCDLVAPLLVIMDDEPKVYSCFCELMQRMSANFPNGSAMDQHFGNMRSLIQIMDPELFEHMRQYGDYTHFYFSYRWFLLDFKRELVYSDIFMVWETIWTAKHICSRHFVLFVALAMVEYYRDVIIDNQMDFTDIIKFFNELAEKHNAVDIVNIARGLVNKLQVLIENK
ncbi:hypothetical protein HELRODRAFT_71468, partial [Helobdella robusta]|uniref:Rab-GAP TBC domain-containing protein n=1 Tax=Helobdella robusta TaxID=6412 RepID=T1G0M0_HELRO